MWFVEDLDEAIVGISIDVLLAWTVCPRGVLSPERVFHFLADFACPLSSRYLRQPLPYSCQVVVDASLGPGCGIKSDPFQNPPKAQYHISEL